MSADQIDAAVYNLAVAVSLLWLAALLVHAVSNQRRG